MLEVIDTRAELYMYSGKAILLLFVFLIEHEQIYPGQRSFPGSFPGMISNDQCLSCRYENDSMKTDFKSVNF